MSCFSTILNQKSKNLKDNNDKLLPKILPKILFCNGSISASKTILKNIDTF